MYHKFHPGLIIVDIQLETPESHAIQSYDDQSIIVNGVLYQESTTISRESIQSGWPVHSIVDLSEATLAPLIAQHPEIILIGHNEIKGYISPSIISALSRRRIGIECMSIGAACRTFNVLLGEQRAVVLGFIKG